MFLKDTADLRKFVNDVNVNANWDNLKPALKNAQRIFIIEAIGQTLFDSLSTDYNGAGVSEEQETAFEHLQNAVANYMLYLDIQTRIGSVGNAGFTESITDQTTGVRQWVHFNTAKTHLFLGDASLDLALDYMEANPDDFAEWVASSAFSIEKSLLLSSAKDVQNNGLVDIGNSRATFKALKPWIASAEILYIKPLITEALYTELKAAVLVNAFTADQAALLKVIKPALAHWAMFDGLDSLQITKAGGSLKIIVTNDSITQALLIPDKLKGDIVRKHKQKAEAFSKNIVDFLNSKATTELYPSYYNLKVLPELNKGAKPVFANGDSKSFMI